MFNKIQIVSPAGAQSGGPESLHNLVSLANKIGFDAEIVYYPYAKGHAVPSRYRKYKVPVGVLKDEPNVIIIFPEIYSMEALNITNAKAVIWWLSVDFFQRIKYHNFRDKVRYVLMALRRKRPFKGVQSLRHLMHFTKAAYDRMYLEQRGVQGFRLAGPISEFYLKPCSPQDIQLKKNTILFSPRRDKKVVPALISRFPQLKFIPIAGLDEQGLRDAYLSSKLYVDFGNHPGKERMPREAAASGCCVITGLLGSAANNEDIPIPSRFKFDTNEEFFFEKFESAVLEVFEKFSDVYNEFSSYREIIYNEPAEQKKDLEKIAIYLDLSRRSDFS